MNATHGAVAPHILAPTMTPPATGQTQPFTATETFLIEASRSNSLIDTNDGGDFNAKWTNSANFNLRRGDRISIEMCAFNAANAGGGVPTIELTGEKIKQGGNTKPYCDNKVLLEIFFYLNNNNTYSVGFPAKFPTGRATGGVGDKFTQSVNWGGVPATGLLRGIDGYQNTSGTKIDWGNHKIPQTKADPATNLYEVTGYSGWGQGFTRPMLIGAAVTDIACPVAEAYNVVEFHLAGDPPTTYVNVLAAGDNIDAVILALPTDINNAPVSLTSSYVEGYLTGLSTANTRFNGVVGMATYLIPDRVAAPEDFRQLANIPISSITAQQVLPGPVSSNRIQLNFDGNFTTADTGYIGGSTSLFLGTDNRRGMPYNNYELPGLGLNPANGAADFGALCMDNIRTNATDKSWYRRRGGSFQRYNEYNIGSTTATMSIENKSFPNTAYYGQGYAGSSVDISGNQPGLWEGLEGYRNGNMMKENNNKPYILTRNDYYGMGRMMPSMEGYMPYLKPQTAFILLDADELFTDLTTLANRINDILHQRLPLIGLQNDNYNDYVLNTQQYADTYQKGSSVIPYVMCNQAYYDPGLYNNVTYRYNPASMQQVWDTIPPISSGGTIKIQPANFQAGYNYALSHTNKLNDNVSQPLTQQGFISTPQPDLIVPQPDIITPQPDIVTPQPDLITPQPDIITPQPDLMVPQPDIYTPEVPAVPPSLINYNSTNSGTITNLTATYDYAASPANRVLGNSYETMADDGGLGSDYSTSHSRCITYDAGLGNKIMINPVNFTTEHSSFSMYDRIGITSSNAQSTLSNSSSNLSSSDSTLSQYLYQSSSSNPSTFWGPSWTSGNGGYGTGGGWLFPSSSGTDSKGNNNSAWVNQWYIINSRYIKVFFKSDGSATEPGWNFRIARQVNTPGTPAVPGFYTPQPDLAVPQPDLVTPQPDLVTPQPDLVTPQPDLVTPQPDLIVPQPDIVTPGGIVGLSMTPAVQAEYLAVQKSTYCASVKAPDPDPQSCSNLCYGNMCYENMPKMMMGDCWRRLPVYNMNRPAAATPLGGAAPADGIANLSMPVVLNTKMAYYTASSSNSVYTLRTQALPVGAIIYTNLAWLGADGPLNYNWKENKNAGFYSTGDPLILYEQFAESLRRYETYSRASSGGGNDGPTAKRNWAGQEVDDEGWSVEFDLGQSDDAANMLGDDIGGTYSQGLYPIPPGFGGVTLADDIAANGWINQIQLCKTTNMVAEVPPGVGLFPQVANPNQAAAADNWYGTGRGDSTTANAINRDSICPSFSNAVFGGSNSPSVFNWSQDFKTLRPLGKIKIRSRPTLDYYKKNNDGFINIKPFEQQERPDYGVSIPAAVPDPSASGPDSQCRIIKPSEIESSGPGNYTAGSLEYFQNLGLPFIPYEHSETNPDGTITKRIMCAIIVANNYQAIENKPNTWTLGEITWGTQISVSHSFMDNHAITPMNGDAINFRNRLVDKYVPAPPPLVPGQGNIPVEPNRNMSRNNFNYIFMGANDPTFAWNGDKNRFEFTYFQQNTLFSAFTTEANSTAQQGESCAILNSTTRDSVFSIIDPYIFAPSQIDPPVAGSASTPFPGPGNLKTIPNQGIRDMEGGIGIWNIWLCPPDYTFPQGINPVNYWSQNRNVLENSNQAFAPEWDTPINLEQTELNHQSIIKGCVRAGRDIWEGNLLYKLGFTPEQTAEPYYGKSYNRFNPNTFNNTNPNVIGTGVKPVILGNSYNNTQNPATNINFKRYPTGPPAAGVVDVNGLPKFLNGLQNNQAVAVTTLPHPLTAKDSPILTDSPFFLVYSNICETKYQSGATSQPALFYVMRNYPNQGYFYGAGSNYYQICNQDRVLSQVTTEIRNPATGELAKLSPNSVLMYKIERDIVVPAPTIDATGGIADPEGPQAQPDPTTLAIEQLTAELTGEAPRTQGGPGGAGSAPGGPGNRISDSAGANTHAQVAQNWVVEPDGQTIQAAPPQQQMEPPSGAAALAMGRGETKSTDRPNQTEPMTGGQRALDYAIRTLISRANVGFGRDGRLSRERISELPDVLTQILKELHDKRIPQLITEMERGGASADEVADRIMDELGEMRFNRQGGVTAPSSKVGDLNDRAILEVAPSGRGHQFIRDIAGQLIGMYQPDEQGVFRMSGRGDASYYNIQRMIADAIDNGAIIGLSRDGKDEFRLSSGETTERRGRREQRGAARAIRQMSAEERSGSPRAMTRSRSGERKSRERSEEGTRRDTERRVREANERYRQTYQNTQPGTSVYVRGQQVGRVRDRSGTTEAPPQESGTRAPGLPPRS